MASATHTAAKKTGRPSTLSAGTSASDVDAIVHGCCSWVEEQPSSGGLKVIADWRARHDASEAKLLGKRPSAATPAGVDRLADGLNISKSEARRKAGRSEVIRDNPELGERLQQGLISAEHVDVLADAERKTPGAASDLTLIADVCNSNPDQAKKKADRHRAEQMKAAQVEARYKRQRMMRSARKHVTKEGMPAITLEGDDASINSMWQRLTSGADAMYRADGGRDNTNHERTNQHRLFDTAMGILTGTTTDTGSSRPTVVITVPADKFDGTNPDAVAQLIGVGPIPDSLLANYLCKSDLVGMVLGSSGENLWQGRAARYATKAQVLALIARDQGCVRCGAPHVMCEAHHLLPWNATGLGETELNNLALVCSACHDHIHNNNLTLYQEPKTQRWKTRPATVHELTPTRPAEKRKPQRAA